MILTKVTTLLKVYKICCLTNFCFVLGIDTAKNMYRYLVCLRYLKVSATKGLFFVTYLSKQDWEKWRMLISKYKQPEFLSGFVASGSWVHYWVWNLPGQYNVYFSGRFSNLQRLWKPKYVFIYFNFMVLEKFIAFLSSGVYGEWISKKFPFVLSVKTGRTMISLPFLLFFETVF